MDNIIEPTMDYDFSKLYLGPPTSLAGGAYFTRIMYNTNKLLYIQTPKCLTKQGFIKSGKKIYTDLMFDNNDTVFINWIENLETKCQELIFTKGQTWFETKLEKEDIETAFTSPFKIFKSGKYYLLRVNVKQNIKIYDETDQIIQIDDINATKNIISILEIQGIKFTNRNFQIEIELKQTMVVSPDPFLDECFIKKPNKKSTNDNVKKDLDVDEFINNSAKELIDNDLSNNALSNNDLSNNDLSNNDLSNNDLSNNNISNNLQPIDLEVSFDTNINDNNTTNKEPITNYLDELKEENIVLDIEELTTPKDDPTILKEVDIFSTLENNLETMTLKKPNQVYYEIYKKAREKAKEAKKTAIVAYLEMKNIKKTYMLDDIDESDSEFDDFENSDVESV
jgi:hypothetical protein